MLDKALKSVVNTGTDEPGFHHAPELTGQKKGACRSKSKTERGVYKTQPLPKEKTADKASCLTWDGRYQNLQGLKGNKGQGRQRPLGNYEFPYRLSMLNCLRQKAPDRP